MFKCPYCGVDILTEKAYWGHVEICLKNPKNKVIEEESAKEELEPKIKISKKKR